MKIVERVLEINGELPPYYLIAEELWGKDCNFDSDGNSDHPDSVEWNELTLILRSDETQRIDIDPIGDDSRKLMLRSEIPALLDSVQEILKDYGAIK